MATAEDYAKMSDSEKKKEDWMNSKWRPMMGWLYMAVCFADFIAFPIMYAVMTTLMFKGQLPQGFPPQWNPLTLQGAGLFHIAMGAVLGLAAWGRTQEKLGGANNGGLQPMGTGGPTAFGSAPTGGFGAPSSFGSPTASPAFGAAPTSFGAAPRQPGNFSAPAAAMGGAAVGAAAGFGMAAAQPAVPMMAPPQPSRPPLEDDHPELD